METESYGATMISEEKKQSYRDFVHSLIEELKTDPKTITSLSGTTLWHYTGGSSLINIIESGTIFATQLSGLNDRSELRYASRLYLDALTSIRGRYANDAKSHDFLYEAITFFSEDPQLPEQHVTPFFVTCFSEVEDDLSQWRAYGGGENGYAIGFKVRDLYRGRNLMLGRVSYDPDAHRDVALKAVVKSAHFFNEAPENATPEETHQWTVEFLEAWNQAIIVVAPLIKDPAFKMEREWRIVKGYVEEDLPDVRLIQKANLMSRHLPICPHGIEPSGTNRLPIAEVMVGPSRHGTVSRTSVNMLLRKKGYTGIPVSMSKIPFQAT